MAMIETGHIEIDPTILGGKPHIAGRRAIMLLLRKYGIDVLTTGEAGRADQSIADDAQVTLATTFSDRKQQTLRSTASCRRISRERYLSM